VTLFVIPPSPCYLCPVHGGVLQSPVTNSTCAHSFCEGCVQGLDACPVDHATMQLAPNANLQGDIGSLLCYCKFGVMMSSTGELIPNPKGCSAIIKYSNRLMHEATCDFHEKDFFFIDSPIHAPSSRIPKASESSLTIPTPPDSPLSASLSLEMPPRPTIFLFPCPNKEDGCFFLAESDEELSVHLSEECSYQRLRQLVRVRDEQITVLQQELIRRDEEIANLKQQLEQQQNPPALVEELQDDLIQLKAKEIWEEITKLFGEEIPNGLNNARDSVIRSAQKSSTALSVLKRKISRKTDAMKQELSDLHPLDRLIAVLSSIKDELVTSLKESMKRNQRTLASSSTPSTTSATTEEKTDPNTKAEEEDPELKKHLEASLATFEAEKQTRAQLEAFEAAAIAAAAAESLAEQTSNSDDDLVIC